MIELTTVFASGDMAADDFTHVRIQSFNVDLAKKQIAIDTLYGTESGGDFVAGVDVPRITRKRFHITNVGEAAEYDAIAAKLTSDADVPIYEEVARELYQWLLDKAHFVGSIV